MYYVKMKYVDNYNLDVFNFKCEKLNIENNTYKFENIFINDFMISDMEVNNEDIAIIKIN